jgi:hypothetical protein
MRYDKDLAILLVFLQLRYTLPNSIDKTFFAFSSKVSNKRGKWLEHLRRSSARAKGQDRSSLKQAEVKLTKSINRLNMIDAYGFPDDL